MRLFHFIDIVGRAGSFWTSLGQQRNELIIYWRETRTPQDLSVLLFVTAFVFFGCWGHNGNCYDPIDYPVESITD
jgi:hypothetical protein